LADQSKRSNRTLYKVVLPETVCTGPNHSTNSLLLSMRLRYQHSASLARRDSVNAKFAHRNLIGASCVFFDSRHLGTIIVAVVGVITITTTILVILVEAAIIVVAASTSLVLPVADATFGIRRRPADVIEAASIATGAASVLKLAAILTQQVAEGGERAKGELASRREAAAASGTPPDARRGKAVCRAARHAVIRATSTYYA